MIHTLQRKELEKTVLTHLKAHPNGISEYQLLKLLGSSSNCSTDDQSISNAFSFQHHDRLALFKAHFLLFHILHRLRLYLHKNRAYHLEITALNIQLHSWSETVPIDSDHSMFPSCTDPLADYYLDIRHLENTTAASVQRLIDEFHMNIAKNRSNTSINRTQALATLDLKDPIDASTIKKQYRKLAMLHHPDRGGSTEKLQAINKAFSMLLP
ncbi:MAG: DNA-J related domain-containing protein [Gammaproteobacteria bacterium]